MFAVDFGARAGASFPSWCSQKDESSTAQIRSRLPMMLIRCDWGLCNRLEVLFSFLGEARQKGEEIVWIWNNNVPCPGDFLDCFEPIDGVKIVSSGEGDCHFSGWLPLAPENEQLLRDCLQPRPAIVDAVARWRSSLEHDYIALHVRRTDLALHMQQFGQDISGYECAHRFVEQFPPATRIFLAADNAESQQFFKDRYGARVFFKPIIPSDSYRQTTLLDAVVDLYVCVGAAKFAGTECSTFTKMISILRRHP